MEKNRNHDGFLKYIYSNPKNTHSLLRIAEKSNQDLASMLAEINLETLEEIPEAYNEVDEYGEADLAFKVQGINGEDIFFGILLEHKSSPNNDIFTQIYRYTYQVMVNKNNPTFAWMPTKAIIIYNGIDKWDPLATFKKQTRARFQGKILPYECTFVNLASINDNDCVADDNAEASIGVLTLKYAFNARKFEEILPIIEDKLRNMNQSKASVLVGKIELYLGEYISRKSLEELKMAFQSIGQRLGFVSAGDERRAAEKAEREKLEAERKQYQAEKATLEADKATLEADKAALEADKATLEADKAALEAKNAALTDEISRLKKLLTQMS